MNKQVSASLSFALIIFLAILIGYYAWLKNQEFSRMNDNQSAIFTNVGSMKGNTGSACKVRAFEGSTKVGVWKSERDGKEILQVTEDALSLLPIEDVSAFQLIDPTPEISEKLDSSSENNPVEIDISGVAKKCDGTGLLCLSYEDGIFKPYLN